MKIAILTSGILPIPAVQGGAVENFLDFFLEYNNMHQLHDITVYSVYHPDVMTHPALKSHINHYHYINITSILARFQKMLYRYTHKDTHYHYSIEYYLQKSIQHIKKCNYDIIILNNRPGYAETLIKRTKAKLVYNLYNDKLNQSTRFCQMIYDGAALIISTSDYITNRVKTINDYANKCVTVYSGIETGKFDINHNQIISRKQLGFYDDDFILLFSGRVTAEKGIMELIEAINLLEKHEHIKLLVIGSSFYGNANNENEFTKSLKAKAKSLKERIKFTGYIPYYNMPDYLKMADVAVIPSVWDDPFPTTVLEAQAMGLPIITTRRGGIPEEVTEKNAILLETDEHFVDNLAAAILALYHNPEKRKQMSAASLERSKMFDKETYAKNFFAALESI